MEHFHWTFVETIFMLILKTTLEFRRSFLNRCNITFIRFLSIWRKIAAQKVFLFEKWMRKWWYHWSRLLKMEWEQYLLIFFLSCILGIFFFFQVHCFHLNFSTSFLALVRHLNTFQKALWAHRIDLVSARNLNLNVHCLYAYPDYLNFIS